ncbi:hypothetical protein KSP40_PGU009196 [Platanthera guangdongensis]|uniref:Uncharacterized protein n=1 Tax=Platanthera guangdongensis TaxID=2320717 RepID=A0ABR2LDS9_9ASPA
MQVDLMCLLGCKGPATTANVSCSTPIDRAPHRVPYRHIISGSTPSPLSTHHSTDLMRSSNLIIGIYLTSSRTVSGANKTKKEKQSEEKRIIILRRVVRAATTLGLGFESSRSRIILKTQGKFCHSRCRQWSKHYCDEYYKDLNMTSFIPTKKKIRPWISGGDMGPVVIPVSFLIEEFSARSKPLIEEGATRGVMVVTRGVMTSAIRDFRRGVMMVMIDEIVVGSNEKVVDGVAAGVEEVTTIEGTRGGISACLIICKHLNNYPLCPREIHCSQDLYPVWDPPAWFHSTVSRIGFECLPSFGRFGSRLLSALVTPPQLARKPSRLNSETILLSKIGKGVKCPGLALLPLARS